MSSTAETAALLRAAGAVVTEPELRGPDVLAARLIPWWPLGPAMIKVPGLRGMVLRALRRSWPGALWFEVIRTKYMDDVVRAEVAAGATQLVLLGAGFDSRAHRLREILAGTTVFEVDQPDISARKRARVRALPRVSNVHYLTIDFNHDDLAATLARGGYDPTARTVVVWSGVTQYLEETGVEATLRWLSAQAPESSVVFDYCWREVIEGTGLTPDALAAAQEVASRGEPWLWGIRRGKAAEFLTAQGLRLVEDLDIPTAQSRYLQRADGTVQGPVWTFGGFVHAKTS
ncbi:class I SAM-dependent methyltransferase [Amycolatopsis sp. NPDC059027]|uniref:class I SAM-dependent methyltransferase n=1 Tax=unclassified Amycolatopsis TaxID=2618356 RepID=UPI00366E29DA